MTITKIFLMLAFFSVFASAQTNALKTSIDTKPFVLGETREIYSAQLSEKRLLNIYLPDGYEKDASAKYPVIYLLDGGRDEDFIHVVGLVQFNNFSWINRVPKSIVVGIANIDRRRDFTFPTTVEEEKTKFPTTGHSEKFISFLERDLQPFIEKNYRTSGSKMLIGQSLGGLLATEILFKKPALFDKYVIISPSLWWDGGSLLNQNPSASGEGLSKKTDVYIGVGKEGLTPGKVPRVMEVDANLLAEKLRRSANKNLSVNFDYLPQEDHATITHQAVFNAFRILYPLNAENK